LNAPYSVWKLPTRSASDSTVSNGWRFVSAKSATRKINADTGMMNPNHRPPMKPDWLCNATIRPKPSVLSSPGPLAQRKTGRTASVIESS